MPDITELDLTDRAAASAVLALQRAAYAVEARLIGFDGIPQLTESLEELCASPERWLGLVDDDGLAGAVSWERLADGTLDICRLVVAPRAHRRGYARALLDALDTREPAQRTVVSTGSANTPALMLYRQRGFVPVRERAIAPGICVTEMERKRESGADRHPLT